MNNLKLINTPRDRELLFRLQQLHDRLNKTNSTNDKKVVLKDSMENDDELQKLVSMIYNPYFQYGVTWKNIEKRKDLDFEFDGRIFDLLKMLSERNITGHSALGAVNNFRRRIGMDFPLSLIFDRSLKARADSKLINNIFPGLVPTFNVALANAFDKYAHRIDWQNEDWYYSRKLDGVRVICRVENGEIKFFSRQGKEFHTLDVIKKDLASNTIGEENIVLDGELCIVDEDGNEDFTSVIKEIRRKDHTIKTPVFKVFDSLTIKEFDSGESERTFIERYKDFKGLVFEYGQLKSIELVKHERVINEEDVLSILDVADEAGWEGIMIRKNATYKGKRSNDILKCKKFIDDEYIVKDIETGPFRIIDKGTGLESEIITMTNVIIEHKGNPVSVGSGFSIGDRQVYHNDPSKIVGKEITVQYFEESKDKTGKFSLRFPVFKAVYENGRQG